MTDNLIPFESTSLVPTRSSERNRGPLPAAPWWTAAGARDRRAEDAHTLAVRQEARNAELAQIQSVRQLVESTARMDLLARINCEAKFHVEEAERRSRLLAQDDPVLQAKFGMLDDGFLQSLRSELLRRQA